LRPGSDWPVAARMAFFLTRFSSYFRWVALGIFNGFQNIRQR
jgi:hypothetical protein